MIQTSNAKRAGQRAACSLVALVLAIAAGGTADALLLCKHK